MSAAVTTAKATMTAEAAMRAAAKASVESAATTAAIAAERARPAANRAASIAANRAAAIAANRAAAIAANRAAAVSAARMIAGGTPIAASVAATKAASVAAVVAAPAIPGPVEAAIPAEAERTAKAKVRIGPPAPKPGRCQPHPSVAGVVHIGIGGGVVVRPFVRVLVAVGHPDPAVLIRVHPLASGCRLSRPNGLLNLRRLRLALGLNRWCWRLLRRRRRLQVGRRRGRLHRLWRSAWVCDLARRSPDSAHVLGASDAEPQKQETKRGS